MGVLLALAAATAYGLSDFVGGLASRRTSAWPVASHTGGRVRFGHLSASCVGVLAHGRGHARPVSSEEG